MDTSFKNRKIWFFVLSFLLNIPIVLNAQFKFTPATIDIEKIKPGGPPKDGIPSLDHPPFISAGEARYLKNKDRVIGVTFNNESRAYPIKILNWHEIVNDKIGDQSFVVTYCPLCGTGMVFDSRIRNRVLSFGVSGLLYNSDILMFDRKTESLWSQLKMEGVTGTYAGKQLILLESKVTSWGDWKTNHPKTKVLSIKTGHEKDYSFDPYEGYESSKEIYFPLTHTDSSRHPKDWVYGVIINKTPKAYPFSEIKKSKGIVTDHLAGSEISVTLDKKSNTIEIRDSIGQVIPGIGLPGKHFTPNPWFFLTIQHPPLNNIEKMLN